MENIWDKDEILDLYDRIPHSDRLAERRYGGRSLYKHQAETINPLPEDQGERIKPEDRDCGVSGWEVSQEEEDELESYSYLDLPDAMMVGGQQRKQ